MKKWAMLICMIWLSLYTHAQRHTWKEMDGFHEQVSIVLHPVEMGNLQPVKEKSAALLAAAVQWQDAVPPSDCNYPALKTDLADLVNQCRALNDAVKSKKGNAELKMLAMSAHNKFHKIWDTVKKV